MILNTFQSNLHPITSLARLLLCEPAVLLLNTFFSSSASTFGMVSILVMRSGVVTALSPLMDYFTLHQTKYVTFTPPYAWPVHVKLVSSVTGTVSSIVSFKTTGLATKI